MRFRSPSESAGPSLSQSTRRRSSPERLPRSENRSPRSPSFRRRLAWMIRDAAPPPKRPHATAVLRSLRVDHHTGPRRFCVELPSRLRMTRLGERTAPKASENAGQKDFRIAAAPGPGTPHSGNGSRVHVLRRPCPGAYAAATAAGWNTPTTKAEPNGTEDSRRCETASSAKRNK